MLHEKTITLADLQRYIDDQIQEGIHLEYKQSFSILFKGKSEDVEDRKDEFTRDVSSFANSSGGILIYGISEKGKNYPDQLDNGSPTDKETLERILIDGISERLVSFSIHQVSIPGKTNFFYLINIAVSENAPHMARDNRYYKRHQFSRFVMEHYEVMDVMNRKRFPNLEASVNFLQMYPSNDENGNNMVGELRLEVENKSNIRADYFHIQLSVIGISRIDDSKYILKGKARLQWIQKTKVNIKKKFAGKAPYIFPSQINDKIWMQFTPEIENQIMRRSSILAYKTSVKKEGMGVELSEEGWPSNLTISAIDRHSPENRLDAELSIYDNSGQALL